MITEYWYSVQKNGEVRFMESKELCELDQMFLETPWSEPLVSSVSIESDCMPVLLEEIETAHSEFYYANGELADHCTCEEEFKKSEEFQRKMSRLRRKIIALRELQSEKGTNKKTFEIEWPAHLGEEWLNANNLMLCLHSAKIAPDTKIAVKEVK